MNMSITTLTAIAILPLIILSLLIWERLAPNQALPISRGWYVRLATAYLLQLVVMLIGELTWASIFRAWSLFELEKTIAPWLGGLLAYFVWSGLFYGWHRWRHRNPFLWRIFHQLHHSARRIESLTAYFLHPLDYLSGALLASFVVFVLLGLGREAAIFFLAYSVAVGFFIHANIRVPRWIGYVIQTPDMHRVHHEYAKHDSNFADFVCWDMLFGTYRNPRAPIQSCGFDAQREQQFLAMLRGQDVNK